MMLRESSLPARLAALMFGAGLATTTVAQDKPLELLLAASYAGTDTTMGAAQQSLVTRIKALADKSINVQLLAPGQLVGTDKLLNAVANDSIAAAFVDPANWASKDPAFYIYSGTSVPGFGGYDKLSWLMSADGGRMFKDLHAAHNVESLVCGSVFQSSGLWMRKPIEELGGFAGLKVHARGLPAQLLQAMGAETKISRASELARSLELKVIDAVYLPGLPHEEQIELLAKAAPYYYPAGLGQPLAVRSMIVSRKVWETMTPAQRAVLQAACDGLTLHTVTRSKDQLNRSVAAFKKAEVNTYPWSDALRGEIDKAWRSLATQFSGTSKPFGAAWKSMNQFLAEDRALEAIAR